MKNYYSVSFQYSESVFCSNIAHAETAEDVERYYSKYEWVKVSEANEWDVKDAQERGKPIVEVEHYRGPAEIVEDILNYFDENEDIFIECLEELDSWDGYLGDDRYYSMDELGEFYANSDPIELLNRAYYGYAEDSATIDQWGTKRQDPFNPNADYFRYNGYGNLVSSNYKDYSDHLDNYAVEHMLKYRSEVDAIDEDETLSALFDELENATTEEE